MLHKKDLVVVSMEGGEPKVWKNPWLYEAETGKNWNEPPGMVRFASFEANSLGDRLKTAAEDFVWLVVIYFVLRAINRAVKQNTRQGDMPA